MKPRYRALHTPPKDQPTPGSPAAVAQGCACPVLDNAHGAGWMGLNGIFVMTESCKLHGYKAALKSKEDK